MDAPAHPLEPSPGRRERKKARTRREISGVATRLFEAHGFEQVTLAQIADAADVSVKTIFNHFGSKEDLYFDRAGELVDAIVGAVAGRPPGTTVLGGLRALLTENFVPFPGAGWERFETPEGFAAYRDFRATERRSPALLAWRRRFGAELTEHLTSLFGEQLGRDPRLPAVRTMAAMVAAALALRDEALDAELFADTEPTEVRTRVLAVVDEAFGRLERAFGDLDRPAA